MNVEIFIFFCVGVMMCYENTKKKNTEVIVVQEDSSTYQDDKRANSCQKFQIIVSVPNDKSKVLYINESTLVEDLQELLELEFPQLVNSNYYLTCRSKMLSPTMKLWSSDYNLATLQVNFECWEV